METKIVRFQLYICIYLIIAVLPVNAQQTERVLLPLSEEDYECLQKINCITESLTLKEKGWAFAFDNSVDKFTRELTASMKGTNIDFNATYDKDGNLIHATYKRQNFALPANLLAHLARPEFNGWRMAGNEMIVNNFKEEQTKYRVFMENGTSKMTLRFDHTDILNLETGTGKLTN